MNNNPSLTDIPKTVNLKTPGKRIDPAFKKMVDDIANRKAGIVNTKNAEVAGGKKVGVVTAKRAEVINTKNTKVVPDKNVGAIANKKAEHVVDKKFQAIPSKVNTKVVPRITPIVKTTTSTQHVRFEVAETEDGYTSSSKENNSESEDDDEMDIDSSTNTKLKVQNLHEPVDNYDEFETEDEDGSSSSDSDCEVVPANTVNAAIFSKTEGISAPHPKIEEVDESESDIQAVPTKKANPITASKTIGKPNHLSGQHSRIEELDTSSESGSDAEFISSNKINDTKANLRPTTKQATGVSTNKTNVAKIDTQRDLHQAKWHASSGKISEIAIQRITWPAERLGMKSDDEDSSSDASGSDSGDDEDISDEESSQKYFADKVSSSTCSPIDCSGTQDLSDIPSSFASANKAQTSHTSAQVPNSSPDPFDPLRSPKIFLPTAPTINPISYGELSATQPAVPTGNVPSLRKFLLDKNPTLNVMITGIQRSSNPIDPESIPRWFPRKVKSILKAPTCPNSLGYKASRSPFLVLSTANAHQSIRYLTRFRNWLSQHQFYKWERYTEPASHRYKLTKLLLLYHTKKLSMTKARLDYRLKQRNMWKAEGLHTIKELEKYTKGLKFLDGVLELVFAGERKMYRRHLDRNKAPYVARPSFSF